MRSHHRPALRGIAAVAALSLLALAGCSGGDTKADAGKAPEPAAVTDGVVNLDVGSPITSYDPAKGSGFQDAIAATAMYDTLVNVGPDGKLVAGLATSWKGDLNSATFQLKKGVTCSDSTALTPQAVADSLNRFFDPATAAPLLALAIGAGNSAKATAGPDSVTVKVAQPWSGIVNGMSVAFSGIVCPSGLKDPQTLTTASAGTGAFVSADQVAGSNYTFTRREDYKWGPSYPGQQDGALPKKLVLKVVADDNTRANLMATNALQVGSFTSDAWNRFKDSTSIVKTTSPQTDTFLIFNETDGHPTADKAIRLAISQAVNREALNKVQSFGAGELISNLGEKSYECYDDSLDALLPKYDAAAAATALKGVKLRVIGTNYIASGDGNNYVLSALQAAGADSTLNNMDNAAWVNDLFSAKNDWDVTILGYGNTLSSLIAAGGFFSGPPTPKGQNLGAVKNPAADAALVEAGKTTGCDAITTFQKALITNNDVMPLSTIPVNVLFAGGVTGLAVKGFPLPTTLRVAK